LGLLLVEPESTDAVTSKDFYTVGTLVRMHQLNLNEGKIQLIAEGLSSKEIAAHLGVSHKTIESHRASVMEKLDIHKASALVRYAIREGLVAP